MHVRNDSGDGRPGRPDRSVFGFRSTMKIAGFCVLVILMRGSARADDRKSDPEAVEFFESKVRPVLVEHCYKCHSTQSKPLKGGLRLDSLDAMRKGGDMGPAVVPGDLDASLLVQAVRYKDEALRMPPKGKLPEATIASIEHWVKGGAVVPHAAEVSIASSVAKKPAGIDFEAAGKHWAYHPIRKPAIPEVRHREWPSSPVDAFVLAKLEASGLTPSPPTDRRAPPSGVLRPGRTAADGPGSRGVRSRSIAGRLRPGRRSPSGFAEIRRAVGAALA